MDGAQAALSGYEGFWQRLIAPQPRVAAGIALNAAGATAMMDISDGLSLSLHDMLGVNECGFAVETARLPLPAGNFPVAGVEATAIGRVVAEHGVFADGTPLPARGYMHRWAEEGE
ncbi:hypothetical protein [Methanofollis ethanolicus]|uniref:hypothetical protein n=1 Tax=Methanofollis ethanolicus TaxID=488124 RepID=UPI000835CEC2|nr:hypothetical protein [Methanofollis ethanolicus]